MSANEICVEIVNMLELFEIKKDVVLDLLKNVKVDRSPGSDGIYPRDSQHGFVQGRLCLTNLNEYFEDVTKVINMGRTMDVVYLDVSKAFDKIQYGRLLQKIKMHEIHGDLMRGFRISLSTKDR
eukprot:g29116.t1